MTRTFGGSQLWRALHASTALVVSLAGLAAAGYPVIARADTPVLPQGGTVVVGAATIKSSIPNSLDVTTATDRTAINWQSFSIGAGGTVSINQPHAGSLTLNQVTGADPSAIFGSLKSNGAVVLANPNGIWFGPGSHVDVASIVATTATASQAALNAFAHGGALMLDQAGRPDASVVNAGSISIGDEGLAGLVAPGVANNGIIAARLGRVVLASGTVATLDFYGDGLISFAVGGSVTAQAKDQAGRALSAAVVNSGTITNAGGTVLMTAAAAKTVVDNTINMSGVVVASAVNARGGEIDLDGGSGTTNVSGQLLASSKTAGGGTINVTGHSVELAPTARIAADGAAGGSVAVGGDLHGGGTLAHASDVTLAAGSTISADGATGTGGTVAVWSDGITKAGGHISAVGAIPGGLVETSGHTLDFGGISVQASSWLLDPVSLELTDTDQGSISAALNNNTSVFLVTAAGSAPSGGYGTADSADTAGDIIIDAAGGLAPNGISWSTGSALSLNAAGAVILASGAKIENSSSATINLASGSGVSIASSAVVSTTSGYFYTSDSLAGGSAGSSFGGSITAYSISLTDGASLSIAGSISSPTTFSAVAPILTVAGTINDSSQVSLMASTSLTIAQSAQVTAGANSTILNNYDYYYPESPVADIEGTLTAGSISINATYLTLGAAASLHATYNESLTASSGLSIFLIGDGLREAFDPKKSRVRA